MIVYDIAMRVPFRGLRRRQGVLLEGKAGWAEWSPFPEYGDEEAATWLLAALDIAEHGFPGPFRDQVPVNGIVPALAPDDAVRRARETGCRTIKIKVAGETSLDDDLARVRAVREALPEAQLRVDANGGWSLDEATRALSALAPLQLQYAEQPCASVDDLARLRSLGLGVPIVADESIRKADDPYRVAELDAADGIVLKVQPLGGIRRCLALAKELKMPCVVSSAVETSVGIAAGVALAAALPELPWACGLETVRLLAGDVVERPLLPQDGWLTPPIVGLEPTLASRHLADDGTTRWWQARLERAQRVLEESGQL
uniref:o-succinylbenzoate synthase n=1 Tax=Tessaracoccus timonensis TaxID=2161816 RepID=UPI000D554004|nr:o-succinylbenzoate synthase [Tessaracoccus timonensis]